MSSSNSLNVRSGLSLSFFSVYGYFLFIFFNRTRKLRAKWRNRFLSSDMPLRPYGFTILILHDYTKIVYSIQAFDILIHSIWIHLRHVLSEWIQVFCNSETRLDYDILHPIFSFHMYLAFMHFFLRNLLVYLQVETRFSSATNFLYLFTCSFTSKIEYQIGFVLTIAVAIDVCWKVTSLILR